MTKYIMSIDQGTTGTTVLLIDKAGQVAGRAYQEFTQIYPQPGWVEHDPEEIWQVSHQVMEAALADAGTTANAVAAIGITNQRETTVLFDRKSGQPLHNAIVWQCRRTAAKCTTLKEQGLAEKFQQKTGLVLDPYFSGTKIAWLLEQKPQIAAQAQAGDVAFGTIDTWLIYKLTGHTVHATDYTNASRTLIFNIHTKKWDAELLDILNIPAAILPQVYPSAGVLGTTAPEAFFGVQVPIAGVAGDQQAALYGQGCWEPGMAKNTYGTGSFMLINTGQQATLSRQGLLTTLCCDQHGQPAYALEGAIFITGAAVQWLRDELQLIENAAQTEEIATSIPDTGGVYLVPAFVGLGAPYWDSQARGAIVGLTRGSGRAHIIRATLEAMAYQTRDVLEVMKAESGVALTRLNVDGGAARNNFLMQFQADILNVPVDRPRMTETTALGAAFLAGLGSGFWPDPQSLAKVRVCERLFEPCMSAEQRTRLYQGWQAAVARVITKSS